ncbi:MAG TPA: sulfatase [Luteolibacter sp.]|nr:sulfatase [Luteolibacter sp.]
MVSLALHAAEPARPNILWITSEDNGAHWLGCYGNKQASTPRLDRLAAEGVLFRQAYANSPVCATARSTILTGVYAASMGTQHMRSRHEIPGRILSHAAHLREQGYYCTNHTKTDYNIKGKDQRWWDDSTNKAHYKNRGEGQPFFAIFNLTVSHESSLFPQKRGKGPRRLKPSEVDVPPYLPDLPEVREDIAAYHDKMSELDSQVGRLLDELEKRGLADDTIVFYYSDHAGPLPRGKRYLKQTGVHVPLIVRVPEKWRHLSPYGPGEAVDELVSFVDFSPTLLSLAGLEIPDYMQGRAFLGKHRKEPGDGIWLYADRFDEIYGMRRGWTDGRWKYIRRFTPHLPAAPYSEYQFSMPSWVAWRKAWQDGKLDETHRRMWEAPQPVEELFDMQADPWETRNLAGEPAHADKLAAMRAKLRDAMVETKDTGVVPEPMFAKLSGGRPLAELVREPEFGHEALVDLAFAATAENAEIGLLEQAATSGHPVKRYWGLLGLMVRGKADGARDLVDDPHSVIRTLAAETLHAAGDEETARKSLLAELARENDEYSVLYLLNAMTRLEMNSHVPHSWVTANLNNPQAGEYAKRYAQRLLNSRKR